jgi:hypothetical protein
LGINTAPIPLGGRYVPQYTSEPGSFQNPPYRALVNSSFLTETLCNPVRYLPMGQTRCIRFNFNDEFPDVLWSTFSSLRQKVPPDYIFQCNSLQLSMGTLADGVMQVHALSTSHLLYEYTRETQLIVKVGIDQWKLLNLKTYCLPLTAHPSKQP